MNTLLDGIIPKIFHPSAGQRLQKDLQAVLTDAQALLQATAEQSGDKVDEIRVNITRSIQNVKDCLQAQEAAIVAESKAAIQATDSYVHAHPWQSVATGAVVGFAIGWLIKR